MSRRAFTVCNWNLVAPLFAFLCVLPGIFECRARAAGGALRDIGSFELIDQLGRQVNEHSFKGKPSVIFFGFTHCPDICPTTLYEITNRLHDLGPFADKVNIIFVTVDPDRDTKDVLQDYLTNFDPRIIGLTGKPEMVASLAKALGATFKKVPTQGGDYVMDHSIVHFLVDKEWRRVGVLYVRGGEAGSTHTLAKLRELIGD